jgi:long-chain fatty acid transport protein
VVDAARLAPGLLAAALLGLAAEAQSQEIVTFELSYSNPGARSLGFGGAFVALADDATAAFANPAGLVQLVDPEVSAELRHWHYSTPFVAGGRISGLPTGIGIDTQPGLLHDSSEADLTSVSFVSFVYPAKRWSVAFYRHQLARFESVTENRGIFAAFPGGGVERIPDLRSRFDLRIHAYGASAALRLTDTLSVGGGVALFGGGFTLERGSYLPDQEIPAGFFSPTSFLDERLQVRLQAGADDTDWGMVAGVLWSPSERWRLGAFFRQGPDLDTSILFTAGPTSPGGLPGGIDSLAGSFSLVLPDVYGLGAAYRSPDGRLTVSFEWDRIGYSSLSDSLHQIEELSDGIEITEVVDDGDELHLGAEYALIESRPVVAVRLGLWLDPDHRLRATTEDPLSQAFFQAGQDELHYAVGAGVSFDRVQLDLGADFSESRKTVSLSGIYRF